MAVTGAYKTYDAVGNREDLTNAIYKVAREETPFITQICGRTTADGKLHEWQTQELATPNPDNAIIEGDDASTSSITPTVRIGNHCQLMDKTATVSSTQDKVKKAGRSKEMAYQMNLKSIELMKDLEAAALYKNQNTAGSTSVARKMRGAESWISTNVTSGTSGSTTSAGVVTDGTQAAITKAMIDTQIKNVWAAGGKVQTIMVGAFNKQKVSSVLNGAAVNNRQVAANKKEIADAVDVYMSDFGTIKIVPNAVQRDRTVFMFQDDMWDVAYLQPVGTFKKAKTGHAKTEVVFLEATLVCKNEKANAKIADRTTS